MSKQFDAAKSLYGSGHANAARVKGCVAMPGTREQTVLTPPTVWRGLLDLWGRVEYDPCAPAEACAYVPLGVELARSTSWRGLLDPWPNKTYCNPPYGDSLFAPETQTEPWADYVRAREAHKDARQQVRATKHGIKSWADSTDVYGLERYAQCEAQLAALITAGVTTAPKKPFPTADLRHWLAMGAVCPECVMLVPNRTNRAWFRYYKERFRSCIDLDPLTFVGHKQAFPAPLSLLYNGPAPLYFKIAFAHLSKEYTP